MQLSSTLVYGIPISAWIAAVNARPLIQSSGLEMLVNERRAEDTASTDNGLACLTLVGHAGKDTLAFGTEGLKARQVEVHTEALHPGNENQSEDFCTAEGDSAIAGQAKPWYKSKTALSLTLGALVAGAVLGGGGTAALVHHQNAVASINAQTNTNPKSPDTHAGATCVKLINTHTNTQGAERQMVQWHTDSRASPLVTPGGNHVPTPAPEHFEDLRPGWADRKGKGKMKYVHWGDGEYSREPYWASAEAT